MDNYGFFKVAAAIPEVKVADCEFNGEQIRRLLHKAEMAGVQLVCFPELSITSYTCADLFFSETLLQEAEKAVAKLLRETAAYRAAFVVGAPVMLNSKLYNCAVICARGRIAGIVPKSFLPNYNEFYEKRWFEPWKREYSIVETEYANQDTFIGTTMIFQAGNARIALEICEDVWSVVPPSSIHAQSGANIILNLSASDELIGKQRYVKSLLGQQSARCLAGYVYAAAGFGESSTDLVYSGNAYVYENGKLLAEAERFSFGEQLIISDIDLDLLDSERKKNTTFIGLPDSLGCDYIFPNLPYEEKKSKSENCVLQRTFNPAPFVPSAEAYDESCREIFSIQVGGLAKRLVHTGAKSLVVGVSGGLDSTLALLVCAKTADKLGLPRTVIEGVTMPGYGTSGRTYNNAVGLIKSIGANFREISIVPACNQHFSDIGHDPEIHDVVYENTQARERTQILMDLANKTNGLVIGTGDLSELALGWATYNGDHISMYAVNTGIPKTLVRHLIKWVAETQVSDNERRILADIIDTPVSPELLPTDEKGQIAQLTEDVVGPYELHDFFLFYTLRYGFSPTKIYFLAKQAFNGKYDNETILKWMKTFFRRFFSQQFKRSCIPDGPKVGSVNLSPRGDWRMPSDASANIWLREIESLKP
ncbi:MAG: NAD(+) synthase [Dysgonamonadaceae bacterium]|jgi:NAD+ synthase (glutamine-hydrolysing)|nr:NAD(+) synthase [Dysgonamonadaceae bacterium]